MYAIYKIYYYLKKNNTINFIFKKLKKSNDIKLLYVTYESLQKRIISLQLYFAIRSNKTNDKHYNDLTNILNEFYQMNITNQNDKNLLIKFNKYIKKYENFKFI